MRKLFTNRIIILALFGGVLFITGCKLDLSHEIWLNKNGSGKALITAQVKYDLAYADEVDEDLFYENGLQNYIDRINETPKCELLSSKIINNTDEETFDVTYKVEFSFKDPYVLNAILAQGDYSTAIDLGTEKGKKAFKCYPANLEILNASTLEAKFPDYKDFDTDFTLILHTPAKIKAVDPEDITISEQKTATYNVKIDEMWWGGDDEEIDYYRTEMLTVFY